MASAIVTSPFTFGGIYYGIGLNITDPVVVGVIVQEGFYTRNIVIIPDGSGYVPPTPPPVTSPPVSMGTLFVATTAQAVAGTDDASGMTPLKVSQAIAAKAATLTGPAGAQGPAGPQGPAPTASQIQAAVTPILGQPGGVAGADALTSEIARATAAEAAAVQTSFVNALLFG